MDTNAAKTATNPIDEVRESMRFGNTAYVVGTDNVRDAIVTLTSAAPGDIQKIAASQITLLTSYYDAVLRQATMSFRWALGAAIVGLLFFITAIVFLLTTSIQEVATVSVIGGALVEVISGINFVLYGKTTTQLAYFHQRLDQTQRFLLANSICELLEGEAKQKARSELIAVIARPETVSSGDTESN